MKFNLTLKKSDIDQTRDQVVKAASREVRVKGFRKGKAPLDLAIKQLDPDKINEEIINQLLPQHYIDYIRSHKLEVLGQPKINFINNTSATDWEFEVNVATPPEIDLGDYEKQVRSAKIDLTQKPKNIPEDEFSLTRVFDILLKNITFTVSDLLIEGEVNHRLSQLLSQLDHLGLTISEYLTSINKTKDQLRAEYEKTAQDRLRLEFILEEIAKIKKYYPTAQEQKQLIAEIKDSATKAQLEKSPESQAAFFHSHARQKVIKHLLSLVAKAPQIEIAKK